MVVFEDAPLSFDMIVRNKNMALSDSTDILIQCVATYSPLQMDAKHFGSSLRLTHYNPGTGGPSSLAEESL